MSGTTKVTFVGYRVGKPAVNAERHTVIESASEADMGGKIRFEEPFQLVVFEGDPVAIVSLLIDGTEVIEGEPLESHLVREAREHGLERAFPPGREFQLKCRPIGAPTAQLGPPLPGYEPSPVRAATVWDEFGGRVRTGSRPDGTRALVFVGLTTAVVAVDPENAQVRLAAEVCLQSMPPATAAESFLLWLLWGRA